MRCSVVGSYTTADRIEMKLSRVGLVMMLALALPFTADISATSAEAPFAPLPQNATEWNRYVSTRLRRASIPIANAARKRGIVGDYALKIDFTIKSDGSVSDVRLMEGSGDDALDAAALEVPAKAVPFLPFTKDMPQTPRRISAPLVFKLVPEPPKPPAP